MITLDDIQIVVIDGRPPVYELAEWLRKAPNVWYISQWGDFPDDREWWVRGSAKNMAVAKFLANSDRQYLLVIDNDMIPDEKSQETLISDAPIASARHWGRWGGFVHNHRDGHVGMGFTKIRRDVLEAVGPDPFTVVHEKDCECMAFCDKAIACGYWPLEVGFVGHQVPSVVMPDGQGGVVVRAPAKPKVDKE